MSDSPANDAPMFGPVLRIGAPSPQSRSSDARALILAGVGVIMLFFGVIGIWAATAELRSAVVAQGYFKAAGNRKALQHRDGGIVREVAAHDGDRVGRGQILLRLDDTFAQASVDSLSAEWDALAALHARLLAERNDAERMIVGPDLVARATEPVTARLIAAQAALFEERRRQMQGQLALLERQAQQQRDQVRGVAAQIGGIDRQSTLLEDEARGVRQLYAKGFATRTRLLAMQRAEASFTAESGRLAADAARLEGAIAETSLRMVQLRRDRMTEVADRLRETEAKQAELEPNLLAARQTLDRTVMRAPEAGEVIGLNVFTRGGVIAPGQKVLEIVPDEGAPMIEAQLRPDDAEKVRVGQLVEVRLTAVPVQRRPDLTGHVVTVSADRLTDARTGEPYYSAQIGVDAQRSASVVGVPDDAVRLIPGMPAEIVVVTGSRTALQYLIGPLRDQIARALREE